MELEYNSLKESIQPPEKERNNQQEFNQFKRNVVPPGSYKRPNISFNSLQSKPVNRVLIESNQRRSNVPFKKVY